MGVQKFNFAHKFPKVGDFQPQILYFASLEESFMTGQFFFGGGLPPATTPLILYRQCKIEEQVLTTEQVLGDI